MVVLEWRQRGHMIGVFVVMVMLSLMLALGVVALVYQKPGPERSPRDGGTRSTPRRRSF